MARVCLNTMRNVARLKERLLCMQAWAGIEGRLLPCILGHDESFLASRLHPKIRIRIGKSVASSVGHLQHAPFKCTANAVSFMD